MVSWVERLNEATAEIVARNDIDPWILRLERLRGKIDYDGLERVSRSSSTRVSPMIW